MVRSSYIAVFGDTHGHLRLMFQLCRRWQLEHGVHLDGILQCGDLGFFPNLNNLDKATRRYSHRDPEELGFARYFRQPEPIERDALLADILQGPGDDLNTVRADVTWCNGNHEDFQELAHLVGEHDYYPVDAWRRLSLLRSGCMADVAGARVAALGGAPERPDADDYGQEDPWKWVGEKPAERLIGAQFDILLSHCAPCGVLGPDIDWGSRRLGAVVRSCQPSYSFYAHHSDPVEPTCIGRTACHWLNDVNFHRPLRGMDPFTGLNPGCMGILTWNGAEDHGFTIVDEPWMKAVTWSSWRHR